MLFYRIRKLATILLLSLLLSSINSYSQESAYTEWIFQVRSVSGYLLSQGLLSLKKTNSGESYLLPICDFFQSSGAVTVSTDTGCIINTIDYGQVFVDKNGIFKEGKKIIEVNSVDDTSYLPFEHLRTFGYEVEIDSSEMLVIISHKEGLPIDRRNNLLSQHILGKEHELALESRRSNFDFNRILLEGYTSKTREGSILQTDFDLLTGELIMRRCDKICLDYLRWSKEWRFDNTQYNLYLGNYDNFYFPGKWNRLQNTAVLEINRKSSRQSFTLNQGPITDYFIYRNGVLIRKGSGSLTDIDLDLSEENYFANYTVKVIDKDGQIKTYDVYNGLGLLKSKDFSLTIGGKNKYLFSNVQLGITENFNIYASFINEANQNLFVKKAKVNFTNFRAEVGELTDQTNKRWGNYEQAEVNYKGFAYQINHNHDVSLSRNQINHTVLYTPPNGLLQFQHRSMNDISFENEILFGKQISRVFAYGRYINFSDGRTRKAINLSGSIDLLNYDIGPYLYKDKLGFFALLTGRVEKLSVSSSLDLNSEMPTSSTRVDYNLNNKSIYATYRSSKIESEVGIGFVYSLFPKFYDLPLKRPANSVVQIRLFLDENANGTLDEDETLLENLGGYIFNNKNVAYTDKSGKLFFELSESYETVTFFLEESSFNKMYLLPSKDGYRLKVQSRKVNQFDVPIAINGVILISCDKDLNVSQVEITQEGKSIYSGSKCSTPVVLDKMTANT
ncbi:MAG TPA: hypothetical protein VKZ84_06290, partial [Bacteriovoracaceae bacterium]|nr:hypothetical protein [Bacteriovoracaceae bacterium]